jgi:hypothetical protein
MGRLRFPFTCHHEPLLYGPSARKKADNPNHQENEETNLRNTSCGAGNAEKPKRTRDQRDDEKR